MSEIMASLALVSVEDEGALVQGGVLVPMGAWYEGEPKCERDAGVRVR
jgi:hypothetical protein